MGILLEIKGGPFAGRKVPLRAGEALLIGRAQDRAQFAIPHDGHMSGLHFAVECGPSGCRLTDKKSTNGTFLNGAKVQDAMLATGDEIRSGQTVFVVRILRDDQLPAASSAPLPMAQAPAAAPDNSAAPSPAPARPPVGNPAVAAAAAPAVRAPAPASSGASAPAVQRAAAPSPSAPPAAVVRTGRPPALIVGSWSFAVIPDGWQAQQGLGIQLDTQDAFPSSIGAMEEPLGPGITLQQYVEAQTKMFREYLREPKIDAALPRVIPGASETIALDVRYSTKDGQSIYYQRVYARSGSLIGVLTVTALEKDLAAVRPAYESVLNGVSFAGNPSA